MCGIVGFLAPPGSFAEEALRLRLEPMCDVLAHRGPDASGVWVDAAGGVGFGHRRLAVIDLTSTGVQPMVSASGRTVIVYNGECYETGALRAAVERVGPPLRGHSDTEVILEACERLGLEATLPRLVGMFAFALYDRDSRRTHLVRDRLGIKPLYLAEPDGDGVIRFASETRSLRASAGSPMPIDRSAVASFLLHGHLTAGRSIHAGVRQVSPGTVVTLGADGRASESVWWSLDSVVEAGAASRHRPLDSSIEREHLDEMDGLLSRAVRSRMVADVPLGAFLSGGVDSSVVVALMQEHSARAIETFSVGSHDSGYDESSFARAVAQHLGTRHTEVVLEDAEIVALVPSILAGLDEPLADPSLVPTWLVSQLARRQVTVALSGDGGDEVFGGYTRHRVAASRMATLLSLPTAVKRPLAAGLRVVPPGIWDALAGLLPSSRRPGRAGEQVQKIARVLSARDVDDLHRRLVEVWDEGPLAVRGAAPGVSLGTGNTVSERYPSLATALLTLHPSERMMALDTLAYLVDDVLVKVDRASMAHSLEVRVPLLDHRVVEKAWALPLAMRIRGARTKWVLREVLARRVPSVLTERPKRGFAQPIGAWLRGPLRPWAEDLLSPVALDRVGLIRSEPVRAIWSEHVAGRADHHAALWAVLVLQCWSDAVGVTAEALD